MFSYSRDLECWQSYGETVSVEYSRETLRDNSGDVRILDRYRRLLSTRPATKVLPRNENVSWFDFLVELWIEPVHRILCHFNGIVSSCLEAEWNYDIGVHVVWPNPCSPTDYRGGLLEGHRKLLGSTIRPSRAEAAAVAGEDR